jgi:hypothetical protein
MKRVVLAWVLCLGLTPGALAGPVITSVTGGQDFTNSNFTVGWQFTPVIAVTVTALGFYDADQNGLVNAHPVGIFGPSGLVVSGTVPAGTAGTLDGLFHYTDVAPTLLSAGTTYRIGGLITLADPFRSFLTGPQPTITVDPAITFQGGAFIAGAVLADPTTVDGGNRRFGPNFIIAQGQVVPEPSALLLWATAAVCAAGFRLRRILGKGQPQSQ